MWGEEAKFFLEPDPVVEGFHIIEDGSSGLITSLVSFMVDQFAFHGDEKGPHTGIAPAMPDRLGWRTEHPGRNGKVPNEEGEHNELFVSGHYTQAGRLSGCP